VDYEQRTTDHSLRTTDNQQGSAEMERPNFENLRVYQLAEQPSDEIWSIALQWDKFAKDTIGKQMVRSTDSIGANIAEGAGQLPR
jgi:hypothetical protein